MGLKDHLAAHWSLDEASGARSDAYGIQSLAEAGTVGQAAGKFGNAALFTSASGQYLSRADNAGFRVNGLSMTLAGWFYCGSPGLYALVGKQVGYHLYVRTNQAEFRVFDGTTYRTAVKTMTISAGVWYWMLGEFNAGALTVGFDINNSGTPGTATATGQVQDDASQFAIGLPNSGFSNFNGRADSVSLWRRLLTPSEKAQLYSAGDGLAYEAWGGDAAPPAIWTGIGRVQ